MADAYISMGRYNAALSCLDEGSEYLKKLPGITRGAKYNILRGLIALKIGDLEKAEALFEKSLKTFKICGNKRWIGISHHRIGETNYYIGDFEKADYHLGKALRLFEHIGAKARSTKVLAGYGVLFSRQGRLHHAASFFGKALMLARQTGDVINETYILSALAETKRHTAPPSVQEHTFKQALEKTRIIHDTVGEAYALCGLSYTKAKIGLYKEATRFAKQSLDLFKKANHIIGIIRATKYLGDIAYAQKKYRSAQKSFNSLLEQTRKDNISQIKGDLYKRLGHIEFKTGNL
jgi:tetratricopeptide (TPR) repeat protein